MQKKLIVLALASAFAAPVFAATSNVDIYGQFDVSVDYVSGLGAKAATSSFGGRSNHAWRLSSNASRIGFKGSEDLGGGLAAIWQWEQGLNLDAGNESTKVKFNNGDTNTATNNSVLGAQRNTFLGLKGGFGTVLAGTHDTPYKLSTSSLDPFADTAGDYNAIIGSFGGVNTSDLRLGNVLAYITPNFSGFTAAIATSFLKETGLSNLAGKPSAWTGMVNYANGPLYLSAAYEIAKHLPPPTSADFGSNTGPDLNIRSWKLGAGYTFGNFVVNAIYDNIKESFNETTFTTAYELKRSAWGLNGVYNMGNIALKAGFYDAGKMSNTTDTGAKMYEVGADYNLSKRSKLYAVYTHVNNQANADYCAGGAGDAGFGTSGVNTVCSSSGKDPSIFVVGMRHTF